MGVDRLTSRFERSITQANNTARIQLDFVLANKEALLELRGGEKKHFDAMELDVRLRSGDPFLPWQYKKAEELYEDTMKALGFDSINTHRDRKFSMRHPR